MPGQPAGRLRTAPTLTLPPPFRLVTLREAGDAMAHAVAVAADDGAGTLVMVGRFDLAEFAVVLEPEEPLRTARRAFYAGINALADALAAYAPPEVSIFFDWPGSIRVDGALVGGARLAWPQDAHEDAIPSWLAFGAMIRTVTMSGEEPGLRPASSALDEEGFADFGAAALVESFARHLMTGIDAWQEQGFAAVARNYLARLAPESGVRRAIDESGDLLVRPLAGKRSPAVERRSLVEALAQVSWLDPETRVPRR